MSTVDPEVREVLQETLCKMSLGSALVNKQRQHYVLTVGVQGSISLYTVLLLLFLNLEGHHSCCNKTAPQQEINNIISNCNHIYCI